MVNLMDLTNLDLKCSGTVIEQDLDHLWSNIEEFIERYYNQRRCSDATKPEIFEGV